jgi:hypothetical protein
MTEQEARDALAVTQRTLTEATRGVTHAEHEADAAAAAIDQTDRDYVAGRCDRDGPRIARRVHSVALQAVIAAEAVEQQATLAVSRSTALVIVAVQAQWRQQAAGLRRQLEQLERAGHVPVDSPSFAAVRAALAVDAQAEVAPPEMSTTTAWQQAAAAASPYPASLDPSRRVA